MPDAPHPRILFEEVPPELHHDLAALAGTSDRYYSSFLVHPSDWDLVVSFAKRPFVGPGMHLLSFGAEAYPSFVSVGSVVSPGLGNPLMARDAQVDAGIQEPTMRSLVRRTIVENDPGPGQREELRWFPEGSVVLASVGQENTATAALMIYPNERLVWALPAHTSHHAEWLASAIEFLHSVDPVRFPEKANWRSRPEWQMPSVRRASDELVALTDERQRLTRDLDEREADARRSLQAALAATELGEERLLTEQGDALVAAVESALRLIGFDVSNMDSYHDEKSGAKFEDLRVMLPSASGSDWTCLVEIKGYGKGAKVNDIAQIIGRPVRAFMAETGREPDRLWHIVNSHRQTDPSAREKAFSGAGSLKDLADNGGCFIDTRDLFRAVRDITAERTTAEKVRESLVDALERWTWVDESDASSTP